jgi:hypothetical protein
MKAFYSAFVRALRGARRIAVNVAKLPGLLGRGMSAANSM